MWIELVKQVENHKPGAFLEVEDETVARAYIAAGMAKDGGDGPDVILLQRSIDAFRKELTGMVDGTARAVQEATTALSKRPTIHVGEQEADRTKGCGDFIKQVCRASDPRDLESMKTAQERLTKVYEVQRVMTEATGTAGGYTTPVIYESMILQEAAEEDVYIRGATNVPMGGREVEWPALDQYAVPTAGQSAMFGGVRVSRKGETVQRTASQIGLKKVKLVAQDMTAYFEFSRDLLQDSTATLDALVPKLGGQAIGWRCDWECLNGNGVGQFMGYLNSPATILVTRNSAGHIKYQDVFGMYCKLSPSARRKARWVCHPFAFLDILQLQDASGRFIFLPNIPAGQEGAISQPVGGRLLGLPLEFSEKAPAPGSTGDLMLFDPSKYLNGTRAGLEIGMSEHFKFDQDEIAIRLKLRNDGQPWLKAPMYLADGSGSNQVSAFVALQ
jgi:HK97 family phage major capsid protein